MMIGAYPWQPATSPQVTSLDTPKGGCPGCSLCLASHFSVGRRQLPGELCRLPAGLPMCSTTPLRMLSVQVPPEVLQEFLVLCLPDSAHWLWSSLVQGYSENSAIHWATATPSRWSLNPCGTGTVNFSLSKDFPDEIRGDINKCDFPIRDIMKYIKIRGDINKCGFPICDIMKYINICKICITQWSSISKWSILDVNSIWRIRWINGF